MKARVLIEGVPMIQAKLKHINTETHAELKKEITKASLNVQREAKKICPVDTGRLRSSITVERNDLVAEVGSNVKYAPYVEFGTKRQRAQPYLRPAYHKEEPKLKSAIEGILRKL